VEKMSDVDLKPCPFCGDTKLKIDKKSVRDGYIGGGVRNDRMTFSVRCNCCHARGGAVGGKIKPFGISEDRLPNVEMFTKEDLEKKAIQAWNRRVNQNE
jgi:Lar family restriction alleviation protein